MDILLFIDEIIEALEVPFTLLHNLGKRRRNYPLLFLEVVRDPTANSICFDIL